MSFFAARKPAFEPPRSLSSYRARYQLHIREIFGGRIPRCRQCGTVVHYHISLAAFCASARARYGQILRQKIAAIPVRNHDARGAAAAAEYRPESDFEPEQPPGQVRQRLRRRRRPPLPAARRSARSREANRRVRNAISTVSHLRSHPELAPDLEPARLFHEVHLPFQLIRFRL